MNPSSSSSPNFLVPRLVTSRQWTDLPAAFLGRVRDVFAKQFERESKLGEFFVDGRVYPDEIVTRVGYLENGCLRQMNFEASIDVQKSKSEVSDDLERSGTMDRLYVCIDALGSLLEEYFGLEDEAEFDVPRQWREYEFEGDVVYLQYSTVNTRLEAEADRILREADGGREERLLQEASASEDALAKAEIDSELALEVQKAIRSGRVPSGSDQGHN